MWRLQLSISFSMAKGGLVDNFKLGTMFRSYMHWRFLISLLRAEPKWYRYELIFARSLIGMSSRMIRFFHDIFCGKKYFLFINSGEYSLKNHPSKFQVETPIFVKWSHEILYKSLPKKTKQRLFHMNYHILILLFSKTALPIDTKFVGKMGTVNSYKCNELDPST